MPITHSKPQQQTLSIGVSESLREFLELSRQALANTASFAVSTRANPRPGLWKTNTWPSTSTATPAASPSRTPGGRLS